MTDRMENLPETVAGMTVFAPGPENAPSMPCRESEGMHMRPMITVTLSFDSAIGAPAASSTSWTE